MNLRKNQNRERCVALVITLLMLSVITFLAIAFLSMTSRNKSAVTATLDQSTAKSMSESALARAQAEIMAQIMAQNDLLSYGYLASHNYINPAGFTPSDTNFADPTNVNYDYLSTGLPNVNTYASSDGKDWAQNIANLFSDPRPPVFVQTNSNPSLPLDFRFWVDINRNGRFETNGVVTAIDQRGNIVLNAANQPFQYPVNGEPEWIGVLKNPDTNHSATNIFIGRYAFMVQPIGQSLDLNNIYNDSKYPASIVIGGAFPATMTNFADGFIRNEGVGSWELNLAATLYNISPIMYQTNNLTNAHEQAYFYILPGYVPNEGSAFDDAVQFLGFRYGGFATGNPIFNLSSLSTYYGNLLMPLTNGLDYVDEYGGFPSLVPPFDYTGITPAALTSKLAARPWPGSYGSNTFYDIQDWFNPNKTTSNFVGLLQGAGAALDTTNRYAFQRMMSYIGSSSQPEYGVYVYSNYATTGGAITSPPTPPPPATGLNLPQILRTKVNINYDNTAQIQAGPFTPTGSFTPMPTNLQTWANNPLGFFTNAADLLLRSQVFVYTNWVTNAAGELLATNYVLRTFGITNIPIYYSTNQGIRYNEQVHRMLQLAANIYTCTFSNYITPPRGIPHPPVFRPQFFFTNYGGTNRAVFITNFSLVTTDAVSQINLGFYELTNANAYLATAPGPNFWGIPWVVGAAKGLPAFDQYSYQDRIFTERQLLFARYTNSAGPITNEAPHYTNQFYEMSISNSFGMSAWNPYSYPITASPGNSLYVVGHIDMEITVTNNYNWGTNIGITNQLNNLVNVITNNWQPLTFITLLQTNFTSLPFGYYSDLGKAWVPLNPNALGATNGGFLQSDLMQTTYPTHSWSVTVSNHLYYALFDKSPSPNGPISLVDFVNLGPFGSGTNLSFELSNVVDSANTSFQSEWLIPPATDAGNKQLSAGAQDQILNAITANGNIGGAFYNALNGITTPSTVGGAFFEPQGPTTTSILGPYASIQDSNIWMACDPLVHYTIGDLTAPNQTFANTLQSVAAMQTVMGPTSGVKTSRYTLGAANGSAGAMIFGDPAITNSDAWQFPTNLFPTAGWLGRVHRGTPWQTVYLKPDDTNSGGQNWYYNPGGGTAIQPWVNSPFTYPTNDWPLVDLFTAVPNDNAARGLLSVNQTNDAAWAAVFAGVVALTNANGGVVIDPTNALTNVNFGLMEAGTTTTTPTSLGINAVRAIQPNGIFHKIGDILQASALTTSSQYATGASPLTDEVVERIPQQTLGLLKLGMPQFVIYAWGQALRPQSLYPGSATQLNNICTNYQITGEFLTRTVCHVVSADGTTGAPKIVVDSFNIEPSN